MRTVQAAVLGLAVMAAACGGATSRDTGLPGPSTTPEPAVNGGTLVIRSAGEPGCFDWLAPCGTGPTPPIRNLLMPQTVAFVGGKYVPTPLLAAEPVQDLGPPHRLTY